MTGDSLYQAIKERQLVEQLIKTLEADAARAKDRKAKKDLYLIADIISAKCLGKRRDDCYDK